MSDAEPKPEVEQLLTQAEQLAEAGQLERAFDLASQGALATDPVAARKRAGWAIQLRRYDAAIAAADIAIAALLHDGVSLADFFRLSLSGAPAEGLLRVERAAVARVGHLSEPFAVRWEALRRAGRTEEARELRAVCLHHFADRASVWASAGSQALDEGQPERAEGYFQRCLELEPDWTGGLAGMAIVRELRKDFAGALALRERVVMTSRALEREDPASVQRVIRYAAALGRVGRWPEAGALLRRCVGLGAFALLPAERPVLLRVFSHECYAPAVVAALLASVRAVGTPPPEVALALREAEGLGRVYAALQARAGLDPAERLVLLGMCAWLAGDALRAYALLDEAEVQREGDLAIQHLLARSAATLLAEERPSIERFALEGSRAALAREASGEAVDAERLFYALVTLRQLAGERGESAREEEPIAFYRAAIAHAGEGCPALPAAPEAADLAAHVRRLVAYRAAEQAAGRSALDAARASEEALAALVAAAATSER